MKAKPLSRVEAARKAADVSALWRRRCDTLSELLASAEIIYKLDLREHVNPDPGAIAEGFAESGRLDVNATVDGECYWSFAFRRAEWLAFERLAILKYQPSAPIVRRMHTIINTARSTT